MFDVLYGDACYDHAIPLPVLHDEGEEVRHGGGPELAQRVVIEAGVEADDLKVGHEFISSSPHIQLNMNITSTPPTCLMCSGDIGIVLLQPPTS